MVSYVINNTSGVVHEESCPSVTENCSVYTEADTPFDFCLHCLAGEDPFLDFDLDDEEADPHAVALAELDAAAEKKNPKVTFIEVNDHTSRSWTLPSPTDSRFAKAVQDNVKMSATSGKWKFAGLKVKGIDWLFTVAEVEKAFNKPPVMVRPRRVVTVVATVREPLVSEVW